MGKTLTDDKLKWTLEVNGKPAMKELNDLEQSTRKLEQTNKGLRIEMQKLEAHGKKDTEAYRKLNEQLKKNNREVTANKTKMAALRKEIGITSLTTRQLRSESRRLKNILDNLTPGTAQWKKYNKELTAVNKRMGELRTKGNFTNKMFGQLKGLLPALGLGAAIAGIARLTKEFLNLSIQLEGDSRRAAIVFGDSLGYVEEAADRLSGKMGATKQQFIASAAATADLLIPLDFARDKAAKMAVELQGLAGALDEWTGGRLGVAEVSNILTKAMLGENEQLKQLGIAIRMDSEEFKNLVKQKLADGAATKAQAQAEATLEMIYKKSKDAQTAYMQDGNKLLRLRKTLTRTWQQMKENVVQYFSENAVDKLKKEQQQINLLAIELTNANIPAEKRNKIYEQLKLINPDILEGIDKENVSVERLRLNLKKFNQEQIKKMALQDSEDQLQKKRKNLAGKISDRLYEESRLEKELLRVKEGIAKWDKEKANEIDKILLSNLTLLEKQKAIEDVAKALSKEYKLGNVYINRQNYYADLIVKRKEEEKKAQQEVNKEIEEYTKKYEKIFGIKKKISPDGFIGSPPPPDYLKSFGKVTKTIKDLKVELKKLKDAREDIAITDKQALDNNAKQIVSLTNLIKKLEELRDTVSIEKLKPANLHNAILSPEDADQLQKDIDTLNEAVKNLTTPTKEKTTGKGYLNEALFGDNESGTTAERILQWANLAMGALNSINQVITNAEQQHLMEFENATEKKKNLLNKQLNEGVISYEQYTARTAKLDADLDRKKRKIAHDQAVRNKVLGITQAVIDTSLAVVNALATSGPAWVGIAMAAIVGALGAAEIAVIASQPVPQYAGGNYLDLIGNNDGKKYHAKVTDSNHPSGLYSEPTYVPDFGMFGETATPELVFNPADTARIMASPPLIDAINTTIGRTPQFATGNSTGILRETNTIEKTFTDPALMELLQKVNDKLDQPAQAILVANEDYIRTHKEVVNEYDSFREKVG